MHDNMKGTQVELTFDPMKFGVITQLVNPMSEASYYYTVSIASNKVAKIALSNKTEKDKLKNTTVSSNYIYDTYGNVTQETVTYSDGLIVTTNNSYHNTMMLLLTGQFSVRSSNHKNKRWLNMG